ncbi:amidohydrolase family protein [uncultured Novosphingobium sp.]|uniref:N-acyl-D-amino-acid deacylase family protein n=1 Tax=uncultured Novosphingobium sp. TaxID=292277 RepID=UPI00374915A6
MFDTVIRNATIIDGTGAPSRVGDVAITGDRITAVGTVAGSGLEEIDAAGLTLTPGFVDIHTHYDGQVSWDSELAPSSLNGVTSIVMGNCGVGFAPVRPEHHGRLIELLEGVEDIPGTALHEGLTWEWESFPQYMDAIDRRRFTIDIGTQVPHAALRVYVMGDRGIDHDAIPTDAERERMEALALEAVQAGALGITTSRSVAHRAITGELIGTLTAENDEIMALARALKTAGTGVFQLITDAYMKGDADFVDAEMGLIERIGRTTGRPVSFALMQTDALPDHWRELQRRAEGWASEGLDIRTQVAARPVGVNLGFATTLNPFAWTPTYRALLGLSVENRVAALATPDVRTAIIAEHRTMAKDAMTAQTQTALSKMFRMRTPVDYEPQPEHSVGAEAKRLGRDPAEHTYDVLLEEGGYRLLYFPVINFADHSLDAVHAMMASDRALFGLSDGGAHCGTICDASFPTTAIGFWRHGNRHGHAFTVEAMVHGYSQRNARYVGWEDRGVIAQGYLADLNLIDLDALVLPPPEIARDLPAGGARLLQRPTGYRMTMKCGQVTFRDGTATGALPGRLIRGAQTLN